MSHETTVARRQVEITNRLGLHLRPADQFVRLARLELEAFGPDAVAAVEALALLVLAGFYENKNGDSTEDSSFVAREP